MQYYVSKTSKKMSEQLFFLAKEGGHEEGGDEDGEQLGQRKKDREDGGVE